MFSPPDQPLGHPAPGQPAYPGPAYPGPAYPGPAYPGPAYPGPAYPGPGYPGPAYPAPGQPPVVLSPYPGAPYSGPPYPPGTPYPGYPGAVPPPRRRGPLIAIVIGAAVVLLVAIAGIGIAVSGGGSGSHPGGAKGGSPSTSPSPAALTPEAYQQLLTDLDQNLAPRIQAVQQAQGPDAVGTALDALQSDLTTYLDPLTSVSAPPAVQVANDAFVASMQQFKTNVGGLAMSKSATGSAGYACLGSSAIAALTGDTIGGYVRNPSKQLASVDPAHPYKVGTFLPAPVAPPKGAPANGTVVKRSGSGGLGTLTVKNQGDTDVAISLVPASSKTASAVMYIKAGGEAKLSNIHDGTYDTYVAEGSEWDSGAKAFGMDCVFSKMDETANYKTSGGTYTTYTLTLHTATGGNATSTPVDPGAFPG